MQKGGQGIQHPRQPLFKEQDKHRALMGKYPDIGKSLFQPAGQTAADGWFFLYS